MLRVFQKLVHLLALTPVVANAHADAELRPNTTTLMLKTTRKLTGNLETLQNQNQNQEGNESLYNFKRIPSSFEYNDDGFIHFPNMNMNMTTKMMQINVEDGNSQQESTLQNSPSAFSSSRSHGDELRTGLTFLFMLPLAILELVVAVFWILIAIVVILFVPALIGLVVYGAGAAFGYWEFFGYTIEIQEEKHGFMTHQNWPPTPITMTMPWQRQRQLFQGSRKNVTVKI